MIKKIIKLSIILIISAIIGNTIYGIYKESTISDIPNKTAIINENNTELIKNNVNINEKNKNSIKEKIAKEYKGYVVSAKLEIPKIKLDTYVLDEKSEEAMWVCPTKYYGSKPNEVGNYCIAAHNYNKENMFDKIIKLKEGDAIVIAGGASILKEDETIKDEVNRSIGGVLKL